MENNEKKKEPTPEEVKDQQDKLEQERIAKLRAMSFNDKIVYLQKVLRAPKSKINTHSNYKYRSAEDILEAVKPHLYDVGLSIAIDDEVYFIAGQESFNEKDGMKKTEREVNQSGRFYVKAIATISDGQNKHQSHASAREPIEQKGMQSAQLTGATSSYARKYALSGALGIDDNKDADDLDNRNQGGGNQKPQGKPAPAQAPKMATSAQVAKMKELGVNFAGLAKSLGYKDVAELEKRCTYEQADKAIRMKADSLKKKAPAPAQAPEKLSEESLLERLKKATQDLDDQDLHISNFNQCDGLEAKKQFVEYTESQLGV